MMIKFSAKQKEVWKNTIGNHHRWNISTGATRSGKTYLDYWKIPHRIRNAGNEGLILLLGNTKGTLERNILDPMRQIWGSQLVQRIGSNNKVMLFGRECYALGADKINQVSKLQGAGLSYCYGDEVTTWNQDVFNMLKSRLDKPKACFDGTCNPDNPNHWFRKFIESGADVYTMPFCIDDNPFLEPNFITNLKREYAGTVYYDRFILGKWVAAEGKIYIPFIRDKHVMNREQLKQFIADNPLIHFVMGVDIGGNKSATSFTLAGITHGLKHVIILDEVYDNQNKSAEHVIDSFQIAVKRWKELYPRLSECYVDSAEQLFVKSFRASGSGVNVLNARKGVITDRIYATTRLMAQDRYYVMDNCPKLIDALDTAVWDDEEQTKDVRLDNGILNVDSLDSMEYSLEPYFTDLLRL